jgi:hypothetical protein
MKARVVLSAMSLVLTIAVMFDLSAAQAFAQEHAPAHQDQTANSNRPRPRGRSRARTRRTPPPAATPVSAEPAPAATGEQSTAATPAPRQRRRRGTRATRGVPTGVQACIDRLIEIASADPLPDYEGQPEQIINNGLLWNDEDSKCSIGTDAKLRLQLFEVSNAWRIKDTSKVRSVLQEVKSAAPQG